MMRMRTKVTELAPMNGIPATAVERGGGATAADNEWEVRPGGMLVQKRNPDADQNRIPPPTIRVRVKYGSIYHEMNISSQATFGELKKMLSGPTGLHHEDQKLMFKDKERDSKMFLDVVGVKDRSKMVLLEDPISQEKRFLAMRKTAKMEKASKSISEISLEVDRLAGQVAALESVISKGGKVADKTVLNLIEMLMNQLLKLDGIIAEGDVKLQRKMQVKRVQKYVEILDVLKVKNSISGSNGNDNSVPVVQAEPASPIQRNQEQRYTNGHSHAQAQAHAHNPVQTSVTPPIQHPQSRRTVGNHSQVATVAAAAAAPPIPRQQLPKKPPLPPQPSRQNSSSGGAAVVVTTQWETFDSMPTPLPAPPSTSNNNSSTVQHPKFTWDLL